MNEVLDLLHGAPTAEGGVSIQVVPGGGATVQPWVLGSSAGESAVVAGQRGLRFAANYHVSPATVLEAVEGYRSAFRPGPELDRPYVSVSADVVVADDDETARELAAGYGLWVRSIRTGEGAIRYPTAAEAAGHTWTEDDRALVADRVSTQFVGSPDRVVEALTNLQRATGADELAITTMTHDHSDRVRSLRAVGRGLGKRRGRVLTSPNARARRAGCLRRRGVPLPPGLGTGGSIRSGGTSTRERPVEARRPSKI